MEAWYVVFDGKPTGPYSFEELKSLSIDPDTFIKGPAMDDYKEAHEIPGVRELFRFGAGTALPQYFATLDVRMLAVVIDYVLAFAVCSVLSLILTLAFGSMIKSAVLTFWMASVPVFKFIYACIMEASARQGSYGKSWLGLRVCDEKGLPLDLGRSLVRNTAKLLCVITLGFGYMMGFFSKRQQCLHDRIAGTLVVKGRLI